MDRIAKGSYSIIALIFGIFAMFGVFALAAGRHLSFDEYSKELIMIAANIQITHSLLGLVAILNLLKLGTFGKIGAALCLLGTLLFTLPICLLAFRTLEGAPSAPFGGICFAASWLFMGIGAFRYSFGIGHFNDKT